MRGDKKENIVAIGWNLFTTFSIILCFYLYGLFVKTSTQDYENKGHKKSNSLKLWIDDRSKTTKLIHAYMNKRQKEGKKVDIAKRYSTHWYDTDLSGINFSNLHMPGFSFYKSNYN